MAAKQRLLVVDDDRSLTKVVALTASRLGFVTRQCNDPSEALDAFMTFRPDVVMLDILMPEHDGIDVLHEILLTGLPTHVVLTSGAGDELLSLAQETVRFHHAARPVVLAKPFQRAELVAALTKPTG